MSAFPQISHIERHNALVRHLTAELKPKPRVWPIVTSFAVWLLLEIAVLIIAMSTGDPIHFYRLKGPLYSLEVLSSSVAALIFAALALRSAIPGRPLSAREVGLA